MSFTIKTQSFEGPLDLLLDLIEKRKLFINDVSLAKVTDDFIAHIQNMERMPMGESAHFILVASTLLLIKSKSLLPELNLTTEEKYDIQDLETRLSILKRIKDASVHVRKLFAQEIIFPQSHTRLIIPVFTPDPSFTLDKVLIILKELVRKLPKVETLPKVLVSKIINLEDMVTALTSRITSHLRISFKEFTKEHRTNRINVIVSFLAMLELVKDGIVHVTQERHFDDIQIETKDVGVPRY